MADELQCRRCGAAAAEGSAFCRACGNALGGKTLETTAPVDTAQATWRFRPSAPRCCWSMWRCWSPASPLRRRISSPQCRPSAAPVPRQVTPGDATPTPFATIQATEGARRRPHPSQRAPHFRSQSRRLRVQVGRGRPPLPRSIQRQLPRQPSRLRPTPHRRRRCSPGIEHSEYNRLPATRVPRWECGALWPFLV